MRNGVLLTPPDRHWACPCGRTAVTRAGEAHARLHACPLVGGLLTPYAPADAGPVKVRAVVREDYERHSGIGAGQGEILTRDDNGRPVMRVTTTYGDDTQAHALYVPCIETRMGSA
jgi:hypothetical protein